MVRSSTLRGMSMAVPTMASREEKRVMPKNEKSLSSLSSCSGLL